jgi:hypothetical protein
MKHVYRRAALLLALLVAVPGRVLASCGSSSCPIDLRALQSEGRFSLDLSFQYIDQDRLLAGSRAGHPGEIASDHDELRTLNRLTTLQLTYAVNPGLRLGVTVPWTSRSHQHIESETRELERWDFGAAGDLALQGRLRLYSGATTERRSLWLNASLKLPTGATREAGSNGKDAEVTITPGTGSTDGVLGLTYESAIVRDTLLEGEMGHSTLIPFFAGASVRINGRGTDDYRRGTEIQLNAGTEYPLTPRLHLLAQLNGRLLNRDDVGTTNEERGLTGSRTVYLSPGLRLGAGHGLSLYGFVQLPVLQHVNGLQLVSRVNYVIGAHQSF